MKAAILAGGYGTRLSEETTLRPKPMVEIGGKPILWHIMRHYSKFGINEFVILLGYKGYFIKEYFSNYYLHKSDVTISTSTGEMKFHNGEAENWKVTLVDTGLETMTGGRVLRAKEYLKDETFMLTYGNGVSNVDLNALQKFHESHRKTLTLTAVQPQERFGVLEFGAKDSITRFLEKPKGEGAWINGGFFMCHPDIFDYLNNGDKTIFERQPMEDLVSKNQLMAYRHEGFWKCMDTLRDKELLEAYWQKGEIPWTI